MTLLAQTILDHLRKNGGITPDLTESMIDVILRERNRILRGDENNNYTRGTHETDKYVTVQGRKVKIRHGE